ncbi:MAG: hypothetical protein LBC05_00175 [Endomicrobium sp.]|jgi:lipoate-protein ligase A|nr:hypothetical protein [Endomicrobium sp.]
MKYLRWINDIPRNAIMNMALDEFLFNEYMNEPILRTYLWDGFYTTIGYFQNASICNSNFVRRLTGGLMVQHHNDMSYSFFVSSDFWNVHNPCQIYNNIHLLIQKSLKIIGINSVVLNKNSNNTSNICIQNFCENDLIFDKKKIVGSCLRKRAGKVIIQGSIHIHLNDVYKIIFLKEFAENMSKFLKIEIKKLNFSDDEIESAKEIAIGRYSNSKWNNKF